MASSSTSPAVEPEVLKREFSYLVDSINTDAVLPHALSRNLITSRQRSECFNETDSYKKAEVFLGHLQRAVNGESFKFQIFIQILQKTGQVEIASHLRGKLSKKFRSIKQSSTSSSIKEEREMVVPDELVKELADLRFGYARLIRKYEKQLRNSPESQEEFVEFLPRLFPNMSPEHISFKSAFNKLVEEEVSLFNTHYLKRICNIFPEEICTATEELVDNYEQQLDHFMTSATVNQFKQLFPTPTTSSIPPSQVSFKLKLNNTWGSKTLHDLNLLIINFGVSNKNFHLRKIEDGCIAVTWLLSSISEVEQLKKAILEAYSSLKTMGVLQVFIGEEELLVESSGTAPVKQPERLKIKLQQQYLVTEDNNQAVAINPAPQYDVAPIEFTISNFHEKKKNNEEWNSSPFYTHNRGYKLRLQVYPNGYSTSRNSHLSVYAQLMRGEYGKNLEWPFEGDIRVELLNWSADTNHFSNTINFNSYAKENSPKKFIGLGFLQMISHTDLATTTNAEYLQDGKLKLRVSAILYNPPLVPLTPVWLTSTQSVTHFTLSEYSKRKQFDNEFISPPFTTSQHGYKICLVVYANGNREGKGSHLSIFACIMQGQHDECLQWPFEGTIIIELLNWLEDKEHYKEILTIDTSDQFVRVTKGKHGENKGYPQFISHSALSSCTCTSTQYLHQDCIHLRVQAIANN